MFIFTGEDIKRIITHINELLAKIVERRKRVKVDSVRFKFAKELLLARGILALPLLPFTDEESELFNPNVVLHSVGVELTLERLRGQINARRAQNPD